MSTEPIIIDEIVSPIRCRISAPFAGIEESTGTLPGEIMVFPAGTHAISASRADGTSFVGKVIVDASTADALNRALQAHVSSSGHKPFFDFDHDEKEASAWPSSFSFKEGLGVFAAVEWSESGKEAILGKGYRAFSPAFFIDEQTPSRVTSAPLCMGGLVNNPAFRRIAPLWAREAESNNSPQGQPQTKEKIMSNEVTKSADAIKADALTTELEAVKAQLATAQKEKANAYVQAAVSRGAIKPDDIALQAAYVDSILANEKTGKAIVDSLPGKAAAPVIAAAGTAPAAPVTTEDNLFESVRAMSKETDHKKRGQIYCRTVRDNVAKVKSGLVEILAANSLGSVTGDIIVLRALDLLKLSFPALSALTTDFSSEQARQGQAIKTRIVSVPSVVTLNDTTGWGSSDATTSDVSVTIGQPKGVQIEYASSELAGTNRDLFGEQVEAMQYALGKDLMDAVYALITTAFTQATTKALVSFTRADVTAMAKALTGRGVPVVGRTLLLNQDYYEKLGQDSSIVNLASYSMPGVITEGMLPPIAKFNVIESVNLPGTANLTGFGFTKDALVVATRLPEDYMKNVPGGAAHGAMSIVTNPDTGISVQKTDFVDHKLARAYSRIAWAYGVARGQLASGQRLISA